MPTTRNVEWGSDEIRIVRKFSSKFNCLHDFIMTMARP